MLQAAAGHLLIDAAGLSSGGQAIRNAVALSALMTKPVSLVNLRKKKKNSGLTHQNIAGDSQVLLPFVTQTSTHLASRCKPRQGDMFCKGRTLSSSFLQDGLCSQGYSTKWEVSQRHGLCDIHLIDLTSGSSLPDVFTRSRTIKTIPRWTNK